MDLSEGIAAATALASLALPLSGLIASAGRRVTTLHPQVPASRLGGIVVLCAALGSLGRPLPVSAALAPPTARSSPAPAATPASPTSVDVAPAATSGYTVRPGDSLWAIACRQLAADGVDTSDESVDRQWRAIYAANVDVIGDDPDLIYPGTVLSIPEERA